MKTILTEVRGRLQAREPAEALKLLATLPEDAQQLIEPMTLAVRAYMQAGHPAAAQPLLLKLLEHEPGNTEALVTLARIAYRNRELKACISLARQAGQLRPGIVDAHMLVGRAASALGDVPTAIAGFETVLRIEADNLEALGTLMRLHTRSQNHVSVAAVARRLLVLKPHDIAALRSLMRAESMLGNEVESLAAACQLLKLRSDAVDAMVALARGLSRRRQDREALVLWRRIEASGEPPADTALQIGRLLVRGPWPAEAVPYFRSYLLERPEHAEAASGLARSLLAAGEHRSAWRAYRAVLRDQPTDIAANLGLLQSSLSLGRNAFARRLANAGSDHPSLKSAVTALRRLAANEPFALEADLTASASTLDNLVIEAATLDINPIVFGIAKLRWLHLAQLLASLDRWRGVAAAAQKEFQLSGAAEACLLLAKAEMRGRQPERAKALLDRYLTSRPDDAEALRLQLQLAQRDGEDSGIEHARRITELEPESFGAWRELGRWQTRFGQHGEAVASWRRCVELRSESIEARVALAQSLLNAGAYQACDEAVAEILVRAPDHIDALRIAGRAASRRNANQEALQLWEGLAQLAPADLEAQLQLARTYRRMGHNDLALGAFSRVLELDPTHAEALGTAARIHRTRGEHEAAIALWKRWMEVAPDASEPRLFTARQAVSQGDYDCALALYRDVLRLNPQDGRAVTELADLLLKIR